MVLPSDTLAQARASCAFGAGSHASDSLGIDGRLAATIPIRHVIVMMKENRSFDHLLGKLHDRGQPGVEAVPSDYSNPDTSGNPVFPAHAPTTDRHFSPMAGGTFGNRDYMMFGTNAGVVDTGIVYPPPSTPSIFALLINAGFTWRAYSDGSPLSASLDWERGDPGVRSMQQLYDDLDAGTLPNVAFVDGVDNKDDDHPPADLQRGEAVAKTIYDHAVASPQWSRLAILWTYDEGGAFADHVPPPTACQADPTAPFTQMGPRVPFVVVSPWAKRNYVSHAVHDHTAITRFIELLFDLPALTARDANSDALLDMFDFSCGRDLSVRPAPQAGTGICPTPPHSSAD